MFFLFLVYVIWVTKDPLDFFVNPAYYFKLDPFVMFVTSIAERLVLPGIFLALAVMIFTAVFGRFFCGWFCPLGAVMDFWAWVLSFFKVRRFRENEPKGSVSVKYIILGVILIFSFAGIQLAWALDPIAVFVRTFSFDLHPWVNGLANAVFAKAMVFLGYPAWLDSTFNWLNQTILSAKVPVFPHSFAILALFGLIMLLVLAKRRFWCRYVCPLGALLAAVARFSLYKRVVTSCRGNCSLCSQVCRMNAITAGNSYIKQECILCMDCVRMCPGETEFKLQIANFKLQNSEPRKSEPDGMSRFDFLVWITGFVMLLSGFAKRTAKSDDMPARTKPVVRPPGALEEKEFVQRCVRCGNCMKVCITNVLQPCVFESGLDGVWTPRLDMNIGYCENRCNLCTRVCPTGAIQKLEVEEKAVYRLGTAYIDKNICMPWARGENCLVCEEHCPVPSKAIKIIKDNKFGKDVMLPVIDPNLCVGCGICQHTCPTRPKRAVTVIP